MMNRTTAWQAIIVSVMFAAFVVLNPFALSAAAAADLAVSLDLGSTQTEPNEQIPLRIVVEGRGDFSEPVLPDVSGLDIAYRGRTQSVQIINMSVKTSKVFNYVVIPRRAGEFTIGPARVEYNGGVIESNSAKLTVTEATNSQTESSHKNKFIIEATVDNRNPYVGQQITLLFRFARTPDSRVRNAGYDLPDLPDFWNEGIQSRREYTKTINGKDYQVTEVSIPLFPINEGDVTIGPLQVRYDELVASEKQPQSPFFNDPFARNFFDDDFFKLFRAEDIVKRTAHTAPITIHVKPLPEAGRPKGFKGGVGKFSLTARLSNEEVKEGESATLTLVLSGEGNIRDVADPTIEMDSVKIYSDTPTINVKNYHDKVVGEKVYKLALVPQEAGKIEIPEVEVPYFNPESQRFEIASANPLELTVVPAEKETLEFKEASESGRGSSAAGKNEILPIHERIGDVRNSPLRVWLPRIRPLAYPLPLLVYALSLFIARRKERLKTDVAYRRSRLAARTAERYLDDAIEAYNRKKWNDVFSKCSRAIVEYLAGKLNVPAGGLTPADVKVTLTTRGVPDRLVSETTEFLEACDYRRFTSAQKSPAVARDCMDRTRALLERLEKEETIIS